MTVQEKSLPSGCTCLPSPGRAVLFQQVAVEGDAGATPAGKGERCKGNTAAKHHGRCSSSRLEPRAWYTFGKHAAPLKIAFHLETRP